MIFAAVDTRVKNIAPTYFLQHVCERTLLDNLSKLQSSTIQNEETFSRELAFLTGALQTLVGQGLAKEEEQVRFLFFILLHSIMILYMKY